MSQEGKRRKRGEKNGDKERKRGEWRMSEQRGGRER